MIKRCAWVTDDPLYIAYHDQEWGTPLHDDQKLFEFLILEGMQAGLSWSIILRKRHNFRKAFHHFDPRRVADYDEEKINALMNNPGIIRNRRKLMAAIENAKAFLHIQKEFKSFDTYIWNFVGGKPIHNVWQVVNEIPNTSPEAIAMSKDLVTRGFKFVGPTICYAFMQAVGMVNDHTLDCFRYKELIGNSNV